MIIDGRSGFDINHFAVLLSPNTSLIFVKFNKDSILFVFAILNFNFKKNRNAPKVLLLSCHSRETIAITMTSETKSTQQQEVKHLSCAGTIFRVDIKLVEAELDQGASIDEYLQEDALSTPLIEAVWSGRLDAVQLLTSRKANVNKESKFNGDFPLLLACTTGAMDVFKHLVACKADVHQVDRNGETCLIRAARSGHPNIVQLLLDLGFDRARQGHVARLPGFEAETAVHVAARWGQVQTTTLLQKLDKFDATAA